MNLRIGISTGGGLDAYKRYKACGFECIDLLLADTRRDWYALPWEQAEELLLREKAWALEAGLELHQCHGPWRGDGCYRTAEDRAARMEECKRSLRCASVLGIKNWVIHPIFPFGGEEGDDAMREESFDMNLKFFRELVESAKKYDITICCENMPYPNFGLSEIDRIKQLVDMIDDEHFKICLDTGHVNCFKTRSLGDAVRICGDDLRVLHVHDNRGYDSHDIPYFGSADWESFYQGLLDIGYNGVFSFETSPNWRMADELYDDMLTMMVKIAKGIMHEK